MYNLNIRKICKLINLKRCRITVIILILFYILNKYQTNDNIKINDQILENAKPTIFAITPIIDSILLKPVLIRLANLVSLVPNIHWIIVEDAITPSKSIERILFNAKLTKRSTLLCSKTLTKYRFWMNKWGTDQRNTALTWLRAYLKKQIAHSHSIVYFMDEMNAYSLELFDEMKLIGEGKVGVWPVGLSNGLLVQKPILNDNHTVIGFNNVWNPLNEMSIAGFGIASDLLIRYPDIMFSHEYPANDIISKFTTIANLQPLAKNCRIVLVWELKTKMPWLPAEFIY